MMHDDILIVGGYGQVGRVVADRLSRRFPGRVRPRQFDATDLADLEAALDGVRVVVMCVDQPDAGYARACLARGAHYTDVTATYRLIQQIEVRHGAALTHGATAVLSVGLLALPFLNRVPTVLAAVSVLAFGVAFVTPNLLTLAADRSGPQAGTGLGLLNTAVGLGQILGTLLGSLLSGRQPRLPFVAAFATLLFLLLMQFLYMCSMSARIVTAIAAPM